MSSAVAEPNLAEREEARERARARYTPIPREQVERDDRRRRVERAKQLARFHTVRRQGFASRYEGEGIARVIGLLDHAKFVEPVTQKPLSAQRPRERRARTRS